MFARMLCLGLLTLAIAPSSFAANSSVPTALVKAGQSSGNCGNVLTVNHSKTGNSISKFASVLINPSGRAFPVGKNCTDRIWLDVPAGHRIKLVNGTFFGTFDGAFATGDLTLQANLNNGGDLSGTKHVNSSSYVADVRAENPEFSTCNEDSLLTSKSFIFQPADAVVAVNSIRFLFEVQKCLFDD